MTPEERLGLRRLIDRARREEIIASSYETSDPYERERKRMGRPRVMSAFDAAYASLQARERVLEDMGKAQAPVVVTVGRKVNHAEVLALRADGWSYSAIGRKLGVHHTTIMHVCKPDMRLEKKLQEWRRIAA